MVRRLLGSGWLLGRFVLLQRRLAQTSLPFAIHEDSTYEAFSHVFTGFLCDDAVYPGRTVGNRPRPVAGLFTNLGGPGP